MGLTGLWNKVARKAQERKRRGATGN
jgi:hypothetical protein